MPLSEPPCESSVGILASYRNILHSLLKRWIPGTRWKWAWNSLCRNCSFQSIVRHLCPMNTFLSAADALSGVSFSGVAKAANVVAVKVLSDDGSGQNSDV